VVVDLPDRHRSHRRVGSAVIASGYQQDPFGRRVQLMGGRQEPDSAHLGHLLAGQHQGDRL
jgi:hypothetical protein